MTNQQNKQSPASEQSATAEQVRTPLFAALGAGNIATQTVLDTVNKAKQRVDESAESAKRNFGDIPSDLDGLRGRLDPAELRRVFDEYTDAVWKVYQRLAESGEQTWETVAEQPQVKRALQQIEEVLATAQGRVEGMAGEARGRVDDVLGMVTTRTRSGGEQAAEAVQDVAADAAAKVEEVGDDVARETRSASRKAANKTEAQTSGPVKSSGSGSSQRTGSAASGSSNSSGSSKSSGSTKSSGTTKSTGGTTKSSTDSKNTDGSGRKSNEK